jgi:hypothetical protein
VYPPPSQFEAWFPSLAHTDEDVERTSRRGEAFAEGAERRERRDPRGRRFVAALRAEGGTIAELTAIRTAAGSRSRLGWRLPVPAAAASRPSTSCWSR